MLPKVRANILQNQFLWMHTLFYTGPLWSPSTKPSSAVLNAPLVTPIMAQGLILSSVHQGMRRHNKPVTNAFKNLAIAAAELTTSQSVVSSTMILQNGWERCYAVPAWRI